MNKSFIIKYQNEVLHITKIRKIVEPIEDFNRKKFILPIIIIAVIVSLSAVIITDMINPTINLNPEGNTGIESFLTEEEENALNDYVEPVIDESNLIIVDDPYITEPLEKQSMEWYNDGMILTWIDDSESRKCTIAWDVSSCTESLTRHDELKLAKEQREALEQEKIDATLTITTPIPNSDNTETETEGVYVNSTATSIKSPEGEEIILSVDDYTNWFHVKTTDSWNADVINGGTKPSPHTGKGDIVIGFECSSNNNSYLGVFSAGTGLDITIDVYINNLKIHSESASGNKSLVIEGTCN